MLAFSLTNNLVVLVDCKDNNPASLNRLIRADIKINNTPSVVKEICGDRDIANVVVGHRIEPNGAGQSCVVEKSCW